MEPVRGATFSCLHEEDLDAVAATLGQEAGRPRVIVDGSNAVHAVAVEGREHAHAREPEMRTRLLEIVETALGNRDVVVVFDDAGLVAGESGAELEVVHAPDADEWIVAEVAGASDAGNVTVVTSDRELSRRVSELGATTERPRTALAGDAR